MHSEEEQVEVVVRHWMCRIGRHKWHKALIAETQVVHYKKYWWRCKRKGCPASKIVTVFPYSGY